MVVAGKMQYAVKKQKNKPLVKGDHGILSLSGRSISRNYNGSKQTGR